MKENKINPLLLFAPHTVMMEHNYVGGVLYQYVVLVSICYQTIQRAWITIDSDALISGGLYRYGLWGSEEG